MLLKVLTLRPRYYTYISRQALRSMKDRSTNHVWSFKKLTVSTWFVDRSLYERHQFVRALLQKPGLLVISIYR